MVVQKQIPREMPETHLEPCQPPSMRLFTEIVLFLQKSIVTDV